MPGARVALFQKAKPVHLAFCLLGVLVNIVTTVVSPETWFACLATSILFLGIFFARLAIGTAADVHEGDRALLMFGRLWCLMTLMASVVFFTGIKFFKLGLNVQDTGVCILGLLTALAPVYLHFSGVEEVYRLLNTAFIGVAHFMTPRWTVMPHQQCVMIFWLALLVGETVGMHVSTWFLSLNAKPSAFFDPSSAATDAAGGAKSSASHTY
jgi:hypothetical protein